MTEIPWVEDVRARASALPDEHVELEPLRGNDEQFGTVPENIRWIYEAILKLTHAHRTMFLEHLKGHWEVVNPDCDCEDVIASMQQTHRNLHGLNRLFYSSLSRVFKIPRKARVSIREGWVAVRSQTGSDPVDRLVERLEHQATQHLHAINPSVGPTD